MDAKTDIVAYVSENPVAAFTDEVAYSQFYEKVRAEVTAHVPDVSTEKGRKAIASLAYKVIRSKTAIDAAGKKLNEDARAQINEVDAQRRKIRDELDQLAEEARKPLTVWEDAEEQRQKAISAAFDELNALIETPAPYGATSEAISDRLGEVEAEVFDPAIFADRLVDIEALRAKALAAVRAAYESQRRHEADQAELARLRAEQEERERAEREARQKAEAEQRERERREREAAEQKDREEAAAARARAEAEAKARAEQERVEREAREAVAKAEAEARAIREQAEREARERQAVLERTRREEDARAADREHRGQIMKAAKEAIMSVGGVKEDAAKKVVLAIAANEIPNVSIRF